MIKKKYIIYFTKDLWKQALKYFRPGLDSSVFHEISKAQQM